MRISSKSGLIWLLTTACAPTQDAQLALLRTQMETLQGKLARTEAKLAAVVNDLTWIAVAKARDEPPAVPGAPAGLSVVHLTPETAAPADGQAPDSPDTWEELPPVPPRGRVIREPKPVNIVVRDRSETLFEQALKAYQRGQPKDAMRRFAAFVHDYPQHPDADSARYWMGECHMEMGAYASAISQFSRLQQGNPHGTKAAEALLKVGLAYERLEQPAQARDTFAKLIAGYPHSASAELARARVAPGGEGHHAAQN